MQSPLPVCPQQSYFLFLPPSSSSPFTHRATLFVSVWHAAGQVVHPEGQPHCSQGRFQPPRAPFQVTAALITTAKKSPHKQQRRLLLTELGFLVWGGAGGWYSDIF